MSSSLTTSNKTAEDLFNIIVSLPLSSSQLRQVASQFKELAREQERDDQRKFIRHIALMQEIRQVEMFKSIEDKMERGMNTLVCELKELSNGIKGMSNDLKEIPGNLEERSPTKCD